MVTYNLEVNNNVQCKQCDVRKKPIRNAELSENETKYVRSKSECFRNISCSQVSTR